jgi:hypothetical protein
MLLVTSYFLIQVGLVDGIYESGQAMQVGGIPSPLLVGYPMVFWI